MGELLGLSYNSAQEVSEEEEIAEWIRLSVSEGMKRRGEGVAEELQSLCL